MVSEASTKYYKTVTLVKTVRQQQVFLQLLMVYTVVYLMCQPFLNIFRLKLFWNDLQNLSIEKGHLFSPLNKSDRISAAAESSVTYPFRDFGSSSGVLA